MSTDQLISLEILRKKKVGEKKRSCRVSLGLFRANSLGLSPFPKDKLTRGGGEIICIKMFGIIENGNFYIYWKDRMSKYRGFF